MQIELFIVAMLGFVSHFRFRKLLENSRESTNAKSIMHKIRYFQVNVKPVLVNEVLKLTLLSMTGIKLDPYRCAYD